ncbi:ABC transporter permease [Oceanivirga salmonicida]|uniref:ABC transporter permease n=1 Tax=Oceanivirga salmonicida TaxID=1769291 RepID=UPI00082AE175|nr:ABC transporter permease [Oceanivirga salmonicida]
MYFIKKILKGIFSIYIISTISFFIISLIPGDPATAILGVDATYEQILEFRSNFGLDEPILLRYIHWLKNVIMGDFGMSYRYDMPVKDLVLETLPLTILVSIISLLIIFFVSVILSFYINSIKNKKIKKIFEIILNISIAVPTFWLGIIFIFIFSVILNLFITSYNGTFVSLILPCIIISIPQIAFITLNIKANLYTETRLDYVKFLYSNGMNKRILNMYILKNAILTTIPLFGLIILELITGIVIVEQIFSIPGIGRLLLTSIATRDIKLLQALIIYTSLVVIIINLIIDLLYVSLDKRIRLGVNK